MWRKVLHAIWRKTLHGKWRNFKAMGQRAGHLESARTLAIERLQLPRLALKKSDPAIVGGGQSPLPAHLDFPKSDLDEILTKQHMD